MAQLADLKRLRNHRDVEPCSGRVSSYDGRVELLRKGEGAAEGSDSQAEGIPRVDGAHLPREAVQSGIEPFIGAATSGRGALLGEEHLDALVDQALRVVDLGLASTRF